MLCCCDPTPAPLPCQVRGELASWRDQVSQASAASEAAQRGALSAQVECQDLWHQLAELQAANERLKEQLSAQVGQVWGFVGFCGCDGVACVYCRCFCRGSRVLQVNVIVSA